jgi:hypothetical protein
MTLSETRPRESLELFSVLKISLVLVHLSNVEPQLHLRTVNSSYCKYVKSLSMLPRRERLLQHL